MSVTRFERHLLFTTAVILGTLLVALVNNVDGQNMYKDQPRGEQHTDKSQVPPLHKDAKLHKNTLLHAVWIIILVVLFIITAIVGIYYWLLFFPILCKKERKYDVMQMSAKP